MKYIETITQDTVSGETAIYYKFHKIVIVIANLIGDGISTRREMAYTTPQGYIPLFSARATCFNNNIDEPIGQAIMYTSQDIGGDSKIIFWTKDPLPLNKSIVTTIVYMTED